MKCIACGAEVKYSPKLKKIHCEHCNQTFDAETYKEQAKIADVDKQEVNKHMCTQCGATLLTFDDTAVTFCSYCGSSMTVEKGLYKEEVPKYIIPFNITKEQCEKIYKNKIAKSLFAPNYLKSEANISKFRGIYMPYGEYELKHHGLAVNSGEKYNHRSGDYVYYDQFSITCDADLDMVGITYDLSTKFYDRYSYTIAPYIIKDQKPFNEAYLAGYYADSVSEDKTKYILEAEAIGDEQTTKIFPKEKLKDFRKYGCYTPKIPMITDNISLAYFPVYFLGATNNKNDKVNYAVINGQTGEIAVDIPIDVTKYLLITTFVAALIFFIMTYVLNITLNYYHIIIACFIGVVIELILSASMNDKLDNIKRKEENPNINLPKKKKGLFSSFIVIMMIISIVATIYYANTIIRNDLPYQLLALFDVGVVLLEMKNLIKLHNELTTTELEQLKKRGGFNG